METETGVEMCALDEAGKVEAWRLHELIDAGYPIPLADRLAVRRDVDLHDAVDLVMKVQAKGLSPHVAFEILA